MAGIGETYPVRRWNETEADHDRLMTKLYFYEFDDEEFSRLSGRRLKESEE
jgi:hypothetical protein